ncbi:MAG: hypothetical protein ABI347_04070 [Nitrososphaera sp.]|jgi:hypothetical protein
MQPEHTVKVVQPIGEHTSKDFASLPQLLHLAIGSFFACKEYLACGHFSIQLTDKLAKKTTLTIIKAEQG